MSQAHRLATVEDFLAAGEDGRLELIAGDLIERAVPSAEHSDAQAGLAAALRGPFHHGGGGPGPGGWWILTEVHVQLATHDVFVADLAGWRRELHPDRPRGRLLSARPDWWCEIVSPSNARRDRVDKLRVLQSARVPHYWIVDPEAETLTVHRWTEAGYLIAHVATRGERIRAEPFDAIELEVGLLFGDEPS